MTVMVPVVYIDSEIGDIINIETNRRGDGDYIGTVKVELIEITKSIGLSDDPDNIILRGRMCD